MSHVFIMDPVFGWRPATQEGDVKDGKALVSVPEYKNEAAMTCDNGRSGKKGEPQTISLKNYAHGVLPLCNVDDEGMLTEFADMVKLPYLHEVRYVSNAVKNSTLVEVEFSIR
jgi:hypothetical protein